MTVRTRNLLDRFRVLVLHHVLIFDNSVLNIETILRTINIRQLAEAAELARIIHSEITCRLENVVAVPQTSESAVEQIKQIEGASYWTRRLMLQAAHETQRSTTDPLTKAHDELQEAVKWIKRRVISSVTNPLHDGVELHVREFPQIVRNFYEHADYALPIY
jgi:hypothetical protein